ncbi:TPA: pilin [Photobacterium damselae]
MKGQKGFTLIELMIVVAIIGVLSAIAIPAYKDYVSKSEYASAIATVRALVTEAELIYQEKGSLAADTPLTDLGTATDGKANPLGTISIAAANNIKFLFGSDSSLNTAFFTFSRTDDGWKCAGTNAGSVELPKIDACAAPAQQTE